jgi:hypothetical protein
VPTLTVDVWGEAGAVSEAAVGTKRCSRCKVVLPREMFTKHARTKDGLQLWCRECQNTHQRERYASDPVYREKVIAQVCKQARKRRDTAVGWAAQVLSNTRRCAKKYGMPFDLTVEHLLELREQTTHCPAVGTVLAYTNKDFRASNSASLARISPKGGYVIGNVVIVSYRAARARNGATHSEPRDEVVRLRRPPVVRREISTEPL